MEPSQDYNDFVHTGPGTLAGRLSEKFLATGISC